MPTRILDLFTYALLAGVLVLALLGVQGCASAPPAPADLSDVDRVPYASAVYLRMGNERCSGVAIDTHHILTARHCVDGHAAFEVTAFPGETAPAELVHTYADRDAALLRTSMRLTAVAKVADAPPTAGDLLVIAGFGCLETNLFVTAGVYLGTFSDTNNLMIAAAVCGGDSGGPVFNRSGEVVGLVSARGVDLPVTAAAPALGL